MIIPDMSVSYSLSPLPLQRRCDTPPSIRASFSRSLCYPHVSRTPPFSAVPDCIQTAHLPPLQPRNSATDRPAAGLKVIAVSNNTDKIFGRPHADILGADAGLETDGAAVIGTDGSMDREGERERESK